MPADSIGPRRKPPHPRLERGVGWALAGVLVWLLLAGGWYAGAGLDRDREHFYDERYSLENVYGLLYTDSWRPVSGWYPSLAYLPQTAVLAAVDRLHAWTGADRLTIHDGRRFTPLAYLLARLTSLLYAAGAAAGLFLLGRRLFSAGVGLLAALFLVTAPQILHHAGLFKPDALLVAAVVLVLLLTDRAALRPGSGAFLLAGAGVGLAASAKLNGAATAAAPLLAACLGGGRRRRTLVWLAAAGAAAAGLYLALNPFVGTTFAYLARNRRLYEIQAGKHGGSHLGLLWREAELLLGNGYHGLLVGLLAVSGLVGWIVLLARGRGDARFRRRLAAPLGLFLGYSLSCAVATPFARFSLFLPLVPVTALAAGWAAIAGTRRLAPAARAALVAALAALALFQGGRFVYRERVPETRQLAAHLAAEALAPLEGRIVCAEPPATAIVVRRGTARAAVRAADRLADLAPEERERCDAQIFPASRSRAEAASPEPDGARRGPRSGVRTVAVRGRLFSARGDDLLVELHPWRRAGDAREVRFTAADDTPGRWRAALPAGAAGIVSLALRLPLRGAPPPETRLFVDGREIPLLWVRNERRPAGARYQTARLELGEGARFELDLPPGLGAPLGGLRRWLPPAKPIAQEGNEQARRPAP